MKNTRTFDSQEAFEKELDDYFMLEGDFSKEQDERTLGQYNYYGNIQPSESVNISEYLGYFDTNTNQGFMLEPTMAAKGKILKKSKIGGYSSKAKFPEGFQVWEYIENNFGDYTSSDDVALSDDLSKYIHGESASQAEFEELEESLEEHYEITNEKEARELLVETDRDLFTRAVVDKITELGGSYEVDFGDNDDEITIKDTRTDKFLTTKDIPSIDDPRVKAEVEMFINVIGDKNYWKNYGTDKAADGRWFKKAVEEKAPYDLGGWSKSKPATVRRRNAIKSRDQKLSKHKQYISAARALQSLANVTKDPDTKDVAKRDADYFFEEAKKFEDGGKAAKGKKIDSVVFVLNEHDEGGDEEFVEDLGSVKHSSDSNSFISDLHRAIAEARGVSTYDINFTDNPLAEQNMQSILAGEEFTTVDRDDDVRIWYLTKSGKKKSNGGPATIEYGTQIDGETYYTKSELEDMLGSMYSWKSDEGFENAVIEAGFEYDHDKKMYFHKEGFANGGGVADKSTLQKIRKYHEQGLLEITRSGILGNDFKTKDNRLVVVDSGHKIGGLNSYNITIDGNKTEGHTLSDAYKLTVDFIENNYSDKNYIVTKTISGEGYSDPEFKIFATHAEAFSYVKSEIVDYEGSLGYVVNETSKDQFTLQKPDDEDGDSVRIQIIEVPANTVTLLKWEESEDVKVIGSYPKHSPALKKMKDEANKIDWEDEDEVSDYTTKFHTGGHGPDGFIWFQILELGMNDNDDDDDDDDDDEAADGYMITSESQPGELFIGHSKGGHKTQWVEQWRKPKVFKTKAEANEFLQKYPVFKGIVMPNISKAVREKYANMVYLMGATEDSWKKNNPEAWAKKVEEFKELHKKLYGDSNVVARLKDQIAADGKATESKEFYDFKNDLEAALHKRYSVMLSDTDIDNDFIKNAMNKGESIESIVTYVGQKNGLTPVSATIEAVEIKVPGEPKKKAENGYICIVKDRSNKVLGQYPISYNDEAYADNFLSAIGVKLKPGDKREIVDSE